MPRSWDTFAKCTSLVLRYLLVILSIYMLEIRSESKQLNVSVSARNKIFNYTLHENV